MKKFFLLLTVAALSALTFSACKPKVEPVQPSEIKESLQPRATAPAEGETVDAASVKVITISFTSPIELKVADKLTLNGEPVTARRSETSISTVEIPVTLVPETQYQLLVPARAIRSVADTLSVNARIELNFATAKKAEPKPDPSDPVADNEASALTRRLGFGWNLGNHFDTSFDKNDFGIPSWATGSSRYWDKAKPTRELYQNLAKANVKTVRICATWGNEQDNEETYPIHKAYMDEVAQNVTWAKEAGLMVVLNTHHDEYWQDVKGAAGSAATNDMVKRRIVATWKQIAERFKNEGDYLIMETFNEIHDMKSNDWNGNAAMYKIVNEWNQLAVNTIRETGSNNATRYIAVPQYAANPRIAMSSLELPNDPAGEGKLIVAVHCYDPYSFTLKNPLSDDLPQYELDNVVKLLNELKATYINRNIPCYLGEFGCSAHSTSIAQYRRAYYLEYFCRAAYFAGLAGCLWDNNNPGAGSEHHAYFDHSNGNFVDDAATLIPMMVKAMTSTDANYTLESIKTKAQ